MKNSILVKHEMTVKDIEKMGARVQIFGAAEHVVRGSYLVNTVLKTRVKTGDLYRKIRNVKNEHGIIIAKRLNPEGKLYFSIKAFVSIRESHYRNSEEA